MPFFVTKFLTVLRNTTKLILRLSPENYHEVKEKLLGKLESLSVEIEGQRASDEIERLISSGLPIMVARFGTSELSVVLQHKYIKENTTIDKVRNLILFDKDCWWDERACEALCNNAGFFPYSPQNMEIFSELMISCMQNVNLLGAWVPGENMFGDELRNVTICSLRDLEPYYHQNPWSIALRNKNVLVIHPFAESIKIQYAENRKNLFKNSNVLPEFNLIVFKAVQSIAGNKTRYKSWFEALDWMTNEISLIDFDVAIIGCGAYGFPLASRIKGLGKQSIHLGGATQILFGIKGKRWDNYPPVSSFFNPFWIRPRSEEVPENISSVEDSCYW
jgi:hypothetical protein